MSASEILTGDVYARLPDIEPGSCRCCVTSPPYWGLRDYGVDGQLGLEATPDEYVARMVAVFRLVRDALADDGTLWLNLGDSYIAGQGGRQSAAGEMPKSTLKMSKGPKKRSDVDVSGWSTRDVTVKTTPTAACGLKPKDLTGIPWMVAFALRADGWYLRSDIIWSKPNPMPESVRDRPTKAHEYVFLLSKGPRYYWDQDAVREAATEANRFNGSRGVDTAKTGANGDRNDGGRTAKGWESSGRNVRTVWEIATQPYNGAHFATMPPRLADTCIKAGSAVGDLVLDPFAGAGTTGLVARRLQRRFVGVELNPEYAEMARRRIESDAPLFNRGTP